MSGCHFCGRSSHPFEIFNDRVRLCKPCTFRVTVLEQNLVEVIELMEELFESCPDPGRLLRHFQFYGKYLERLFDGIAAEKTKRNLYTLLTGVYGAFPVVLGTEAFFHNPDHLRELREGIRRDRYLQKLFKDRGFFFSLEGDREPGVLSQSPGGLSETGSFWNIGEQLVLEELEKEPIKGTDEDENIF